MCAGASSWQRVHVPVLCLLMGLQLHGFAAHHLHPELLIQMLPHAAARCHGSKPTHPRPVHPWLLCRRLESEADVLALHILAKAGQLLGHLIAYLRGVQAWEEAQGEPGSTKTSHPPARQRIQTLQRHLPPAAAVLAARCPQYAAWRHCSACFQRAS